MMKIKIKPENNQLEINSIAVVVGTILIICVCALLISATVAIVKWILGL